MLGSPIEFRCSRTDHSALPALRSVIVCTLWLKDTNADSSVGVYGRRAHSHVDSASANTAACTELHCTALHCTALHCTAGRETSHAQACLQRSHACAWLPLVGCLSALTHFRFCMWAPPYASLLPTAAFPVTVMWMLATVVYHSTAARTSISSLSRSASKTITPPPSDALASQSSLITGNVLSDLYRPLNRLSHANRTANRDATESFAHAVNT